MDNAFNFRRFLIAHFNDADGLIAVVGTRFQKTPNREAVIKWFKRGSVSSEWLPAVLWSAQKEAGGVLDLETYFEGENDGKDVFA